MANNFSKHQQKIVERYYEHQETIRSEKLSDLVAELWLCEDPKQATKLWGRAQVALMRAKVDAVQVADVVNRRDAEALAKLVQQYDAGRAPDAGSGTGAAGRAAAAGVSDVVGPAADEDESALPEDMPRIARGARSVADGRTIAQMQRDKAAAAGADVLDAANLKRALRAFRQKLKTLRRDDESKLGGRYTSSGRTSAIVAITPPHQFPAAVWQELARQGRLKPAGQGTYQLP